MKEFSVCYDRFCLGNYTLVCDGSDTVQATADLGAFEMYVLGMWNDGLVVTMKAYDEVCGENQFVLLVPDGSEQLMSFSPADTQPRSRKRYGRPSSPKFALGAGQSKKFSSSALFGPSESASSSQS